MFGNNLKVTTQYQEFFDGKALNKYEVEKLLKKFDRESITIVMSKLCLVLSDKKMLTWENQVKLASAFVDRGVLNRYITQAVQKETKGVIFISESLMLLEKFNLECNSAGGWIIESTQQRTELLKIILSVNNILTKTGDDEKKSLRRRRNQNIEIYRKILTVQFLNQPPKNELLNQIARSSEIVRILSKQSKIEIRKIFESKAGISLQLFLDMIFLISINWAVNVDPDKIDEIVAKDLNEFFKNTKISNDDLQAFEKLLIISPEDYSDFNEEILNRYGVAKEVSVDNLFTIMQRPLIKHDQKTFLISPSLLLNQFTEAPYNIIREELKGTKFENLFPEDWGIAYETYIVERFKKAFPAMVTSTVKIKDKKSLDIIIETDLCILLVEIKYIHWSAKARITGSKKEVVNFIQKFARYKPYLDQNKNRKKKKKGFGQIKEFYENQIQGNTNFDSDLTAKPLIPIVVLGEEFPFDPFNRELMLNVIKNEKCLLESDNTLPPIVLSSTEVELIESLSEELGEDKAIQHIKNYAESLVGIDKMNYLDRPTTFNNHLLALQVSVKNNSSLGHILRNSSKRIRSKFKKAKT